MSSAPGPAGPQHPWGALVSRAWQGRRTILRVAGAAMIASVIVTLIVPETYRARTVLLPPEEDNAMGLAAAMLAQTAAGATFEVGSSSLTSGLYIDILGSRSVADGVVESLGLLADYGLEDKPRDRALEAARRRLAQRVSHRAALSGTVTITADHKTGLFPKFRPAQGRLAARRAAEIANAHVTELNRINLDRAIGRARASRLYLEEQLGEARGQLQEAAREMVAFQREHGAIALESQTRILVETAAELKSRILTKNVELGLLLRADSESSPRVRLLRYEIEELERQMRDLQGGLSGEAGLLSAAGSAASDAAKATDDEMVIPLAELPAVTLRYAELLRDLKTQETLVDILTQQFYEAKLREARDIPTIQVLDEAVPPASKHAPKRAMTVAVATLLGALAGLAGAMGADKLHDLRDALR